MQLFCSTFYALGSENSVTVAAQDQRDAERLFISARDEVLRIEHKFSRFREESALMRLNREAIHAPYSVDSETEKLLCFAAACFVQSDGLFDITSGQLQRVWDFKCGRVPSAAEIDSVKEQIGWEKVSWNPPLISFNGYPISLDLGGLGKEYAVDSVVELLQQLGARAGIVNLGGDLRTWGKPPDRDSWSFGIAHPRHNGEVLATLSFCDAALASSGDYERYFEVDGTRYCHIISPKTGMPVDELQQVTVVAPACLLAGSCSTIAMLLGKKRGVRFLRGTGLKFLVVDRDGKVVRE